MGPLELHKINGVIVVHGRGHAGTVNCVRYNEDSSVAMSGSIDCTVKCWDVKTKRQEPVQTFEETKVRPIEFIAEFMNDDSVCSFVRRTASRPST